MMGFPNPGYETLTPKPLQVTWNCRFFHFLSGSEVELSEFALHQTYTNPNRFNAFGSDFNLEELVLFPNPTKNSVTIKGMKSTKDLKVGIIDITGRVLLNQVDITTSNKEVKVDKRMPTLMIKSNLPHCERHNRFKKSWLKCQEVAK